MPNYIIEIKEINYGRLELEADCYEDACEKVYDAWSKGEVCWKDGSIDIISVEESKDE